MMVLTGPMSTFARSFLALQTVIEGESPDNTRLQQMRAFHMHRGGFSKC